MADILRRRAVRAAGDDGVLVPGPADIRDGRARGVLARVHGPVHAERCGVVFWEYDVAEGQGASEAKGRID